MTLLRTIVLAVAYMLFFFLSGYVFLFGRRDTGIKQDYFLTGLLLILLIGVYSR